MATAKKVATKKSLLTKMSDAVSGFIDDAKNLVTSGHKPPNRAGSAKTVVPVKKAVAKTAAKKPAKAPVKKTAAKKTMDRKLIALSQDYEVRDWCKSFGCTEAELRAAVKAVGRSSAKVRDYLQSKRASGEPA